MVSMAICPDSIFDTSSTSLISWNRVAEERWMVCRYSCWRGSRRVRPSSSRVPSTPYSGVRISWLMVARNRVLASLAASAARRASSSAVASSMCRVMSLKAYRRTSWPW
ncbi:hypothetical protein D3C79_883610 [compost metagenome]